ncbi:unnamed protein product [Paramecium primaurelia]|uniref:C2H2-type domain-containing protein n=1 Tax=Paramecium primaurelia TaxID=5886 RepID=A0A8S1QFC0_PARPR|nr:unnamed protein product [Paramecium primaurelia]
MYKRITANLRSKEEDEDFFEWNQMYVQQEMESDIECYSCSLCDRQFGKNEYELNAHLNSHDHKKLEKEFRKRYNNLIIEYRLSTYSQRIGRKLKKLQYFKSIYEYK